jgi:hypothetical protein
MINEIAHSCGATHRHRTAHSADPPLRKLFTTHTCTIEKNEITKDQHFNGPPNYHTVLCTSEVAVSVDDPASTLRRGDYEHVLSVFMMMAWKDDEDVA